MRGVIEDKHWVSWILNALASGVEARFTIAGLKKINIPNMFFSFIY